MKIESLARTYLVLLVILTLFSCSDTDPKPTEIKFTINNEILEKDTVYVDINGYSELVIESSRDNRSKVEYFAQFNSTKPFNLEETEDLDYLSSSYSTRSVEIVEVRSYFPDSIYNEADVFRIHVRIEAESRSLYYLVK